MTCLACEMMVACIYTPEVMQNNAICETGIASGDVSGMHDCVQLCTKCPVLWRTGRNTSALLKLMTDQE